VSGGGAVAVLVSATDADTARPLPSWVAARAAGGAWRASRTTPATAVAVGPAGEVWTAWMRAGALTVARLGPGGDWRTARPATAGGTVVGGPGLAVTGSGRPIAWWVLDGGAGPDRWVATVRGGRGWPRPRTVGHTNGGMEIVGAASPGLAAWADTTGRDRIVAAPVGG
jgi:hypothetical protein